MGGILILTKAKGIAKMKKYNLSKIMKRAWELVRKACLSISEGLKKAWKEAKSLKQKLIRKLEAIAEEAGSHENGYHYEVSVRDWENYGKSRTYFAIYETRDGSKHNKQADYGYFDNQSGKYFPHKYGDLTKNHTFSDASI